MINLNIVDYKTYPRDPYTKAICTICIDEKHLVSYAKKESKDGRQFWVTANHFVQGDGDKKVSVEGYLPENRSMDVQIKALLTKAEEMYKNEPAPTSMDEVADAQGLPF